MQTKLVLDQKWGVLYNGNVKMIIRLKASWNAPIFGSDFKKRFFVCKQDFKAWNAPKYWRVYQVDLSTVKYDVSAFTGKKKLFIFDKNWAVWEKMKLDEKLQFSRKKFIFHEISRIHQKWSKKVQFFQKKKQNFVLF